MDRRAAAGPGQDFDEASTPVARPIRRAGPYRLVELLGRGGMAEVYRAERPRGLGGPGPDLCVVKTIRGELAESPALARMFADEIQVMRLLDHPNIVRTYDHGLAAGTLYMAMELLDGLSLSRVVRALAQAGHRLALPLAVHIGAEIAEALAYAHAIRDEHGRCLGLVHRDVSPGNIMLLRDGQVKLVDFGIAKMSATVQARRHRGQPVRPDVVKGKPNYMAPEQLLGQPLDGRADLFSLGVVIWELLTWRPLFNRPTTQELTAVMLGGEIERPSALCPGLPPPLEAAVLRALDRDPRRRQPSAGELARELRRFAPARNHARRMLAEVMGHLAAQPDRTPPRPLPVPPPMPVHTRMPPVPLPPPMQMPLPPPPPMQMAMPVPLPRPPLAAMVMAPESPRRARARALAWTLAVAALGFIGGMKWAGRAPAGASAAAPALAPPVAPERTVSPIRKPGARIQPLPGKKTVSNRSETSSR